MRFSRPSNSILTGEGWPFFLSCFFFFFSCFPVLPFSASLFGATGEGVSACSVTAYTWFVTGRSNDERSKSMLGPTFVLAVKYRYLPSGSKRGDPAWLSPLVRSEEHT